MRVGAAGALESQLDEVQTHASRPVAGGQLRHDGATDGDKERRIDGEQGEMARSARALAVQQRAVLEQICSLALLGGQDVRGGSGEPDMLKLTCHVALERAQKADEWQGIEGFVYRAERREPCEG